MIETIVSVSRWPALVAEISNTDIYRLTDLTMDKVGTLLEKHKGKIQFRIIRRKKPATTRAEGFENIPET